MFRYIIFLFFSTSLVFAQNSSQLSDSIIKYKQINPTLALDYGIQYNNLVLDIKPNNEIQQVFGAIGEILSNMGLDAAALDYLKRSIKLYEALPEKEKKFPKTLYLNVIGIVKWSRRLPQICPPLSCIYVQIADNH